MRDLRFYLLAASIVMMAVAASAQTASWQTSSSQTGTAPHVTYSFGVGPAGTFVSAKPSAPFSGVLLEQFEQTLDDGTRIARENHEVVMRDGKGRIYRARTIQRPGNSESEPLRSVTITDTVAHLQYFCSPFRKVCTQMGYRPPPTMLRPRIPDSHKRSDIKVEELGTSNISGVEVEGKLVTRVIPEGTVGNDRPLTTTEELWHSNELDVDMQVKRTDPRMGTRTTTMTEVNVGEPDAKYFQIPEGYRVEERKPPLGALVPLPAVPEPAFPPENPPPQQ
jgi:hypothetical protein